MLYCLLLTGLCQELFWVMTRIRQVLPLLLLYAADVLEIKSVIDRWGRLKTYQLRVRWSRFSCLRIICIGARLSSAVQTIQAKCLRLVNKDVEWIDLELIIISLNIGLNCERDKVNHMGWSGLMIRLLQSCQSGHRCCWNRMMLAKFGKLQGGGICFGEKTRSPVFESDSRRF